MSNYHQINFSHACTYLYDYLQNTALFSVATNKSLGGTIPVNIFTEAVEPGKHGVAFWFCWNRNLTLTVPDYFMAFELNEFDKHAAPPISIQSSVLNRPANDCLFCYPGTTPPTLSGTETFLQNHNVLPTTVATTTISKTNTQTLNDNYMTDFPDGTAHKEFYKVNCCFFSSKDLDTDDVDEGFDAFINQNAIVYVRYYFCLVSEDETVTAKLLLFGVDERGNNLVADTNVILERSWP